MLILKSAIAAADNSFPKIPQAWIDRNIEQKIVSLEGWLEPYKKVALYARTTGYLDILYVDVGSSVKKGEVLAQLSVPDLEADYRMARAYLYEAKAKLSQAEAVYKFKARIAERLHGLYKSMQMAVTADEIDIADAEKVTAEGEVAVSKAAIKVAQAKFENLKVNLSFKEVIAPFTGVVTQRFIHTGSLIVAGNSNSQPLIELIQVEKLRLVVNIPERVAPYIQIGDTLQARFNSLPGLVFESKVSRIAGLISSSNHEMHIEADLKLQEGLHPGLRGVIAIFLSSP
ncbi:efflux RND transporter periplasmic adaptor subunit [Candidatus Nitrosacidococcus tergens]|uniref:HlyD family multidrug efflux protein n=1 Tax=Candidatus Nitrosacidococcus tergens TaxID=553981 RepID=A0A7G1Q791_9GAMM|nr:efflux RND transporter periplasmic adaptor subunit [Candidatus Nitrosacidococcus tergens]CAB1274182.1 HlyD family multidrug efflux protein [Candidatus Nitrosacidococcus tergens]